MMRNLFKVALVATLIILCGASSSYAQKFGRVNTQDIFLGLPERDSMVAKLTKLQSELNNQLETIGVEYNTKIQDYQKNSATLSQAMKDLREKELGDLGQRYESFQQMASQTLSEEQAELQAPIMKKVDDAIKKVSKSMNLTLVFDVMAQVIPYFDETTVVDITPAVKKDLGIVDKPAAATATTPAVKK